MSPPYVMSIDQGTTSTRAILFDQAGRLVSVAQLEHVQHYPRPGLIEHDAVAIWNNVARTAQDVLAEVGARPTDIAAIGIANQRETIVLWDRRTGVPLGPALVWQDVRTEGLVNSLASEADAGVVTERTGLPLTSYFSAPRLCWMLDSIPGARARAESGHVLAGTMETWLIWNLTGGPDGGVHVTEPTNASRTLLLNIRTLTWDEDLLEFFRIPAAVLPEVRPSMHEFGKARGPLAGIPVAGALGDQQAALFGQTCFAPGQAKCTLGTGSFLLLNTGSDLVAPSHGTLATIAYQLPGQPPTYALEGPIASTGATVQWLRDGLGLIQTAAEIETLASSVEDNGGCYVVPAFYGLFAPRWRPDARGIIAGLTSYVTKGHLARAVQESTGWQIREVIDAMGADARLDIPELRVDGGMTSNNLLMQHVADVVDRPVVRPMVLETVALGAAYAAGLTVGFWADQSVLRQHWHRAAEWLPDVDPDFRELEYDNWRAAVELTFDWARRGKDGRGALSSASAEHNG